MEIKVPVNEEMMKEKEYEFETKEKACEKFVEIATNYCEKYPKWAKETEKQISRMM